MLNNLLILFLTVACSAAAVLPPGFSILDPSKYEVGAQLQRERGLKKSHTSSLSLSSSLQKYLIDDEGNQLSWAIENIPFIDTSDNELLQTYYFR
jgi:hypothetical protein